MNKPNFATSHKIENENFGSHNKNMKDSWIILEDKGFIIVNKPATLAVQPDKTGDTDLLTQVKAHCNVPITLINRLDRPASGLVVYAKRNKSLVALNRQFKHRSVQKTYLAVVKNMPSQTEGKLIHHIRKDQKTNRAFAFNKKLHHTKTAILKYRLLNSIDNYHLLEIDLITGRHHQIRAQLAAINCPIKGDVKYGFKRGNRDRSIHLHAWKLAFDHPMTKERMDVQAAIPEETVWQAFDYSGIEYLKGI